MLIHSDLMDTTTMSTRMIRPMFGYVRGQFGGVKQGLFLTSMWSSNDQAVATAADFAVGRGPVQIRKTSA